MFVNDFQALGLEISPKSLRFRWCYSCDIIYSCISVDHFYDHHDHRADLHLLFHHGCCHHHGLHREEEEVAHRHVQVRVEDGATIHDAPDIYATRDLLLLARRISLKDGDVVDGSHMDWIRPDSTREREEEEEVEEVKQAPIESVGTD